ncbi:MAG TPA: glycosyltransferase family 1 protein [Methylocella sp.]|jgi:glycosyltransferase involved in cell wall biosynthesis
MALTIGYDGKFLWQGSSFGSRSGHGVHARYLLQEMLECWPQERFKVYALDGDLGIDPRPNCQVVTLPRYARSSFLRNLIAYPIALERHPVDVLLSFSTVPAYAPCKTVLLLADVFWLANPGWLPPHIALPRTLATRSSVKRAGRIVTTTEFSRREIMRILHVPAEKIVVVPHGVRTEFTERLSAAKISDVRTRYGIGPQYILSLNDIHPRKNLEGLVEAFGRLKARSGLPHQLVIGGRSLWPYPEFHRRVESSQFAHDIKVLGYVPSGDVLALYQGADLFVYPSFYEGWGLQVHEAMVAGVPVTVANNTTLPEIAGDAADTFDPYDVDDMSRSMERILTGTALRETLVARGLERVKQYSWRGAAEATLAVCASLAAE